MNNNVPINITIREESVPILHNNDITNEPTLNADQQISETETKTKTNTSEDNNDAMQQTQSTITDGIPFTLDLDDGDDNKPKRIDSKKGKSSSSISISLKLFVCIIVDIIKNIHMEDNELIIPKANIWMDMVMQNNANIIMRNTVLPKESLFYKFEKNMQSTVLLKIISMLMHSINDLKLNRLFPIEAFKYFLADHRNVLEMKDFANINVLKKRRAINDNASDGGNMGPAIKKTKGLLNNAGILIEYSKAPMMFCSNLPRCTQTDIDALKLIYQNELHLNLDLLKILERVPIISSHKYMIDDKPIEREDYKKIKVDNCKRSYVIITDFIAFMYDGINFSLPMNNIDRMMPTLSRFDNTKDANGDRFMIADVLLTTPSVTILDIVMATHIELPMDYCERLTLSKKMFPDTPHVTLLDHKSADYCYIQKPAHGFDKPSYIYTKTLIGAIVGRKKKQAYVAFLRTDGTLEIKVTSDICGPAAIRIAIAEHQQDANAKTSIELNGVQTPLVGLRNDSDEIVFKRAIPVEIKDSNKLGSITDHTISMVSELKQPTMNKDPKVQIICNDNKLLKQLADSLVSSKTYAIFQAMLMDSLKNMTTVDLSGL